MNMESDMARFTARSGLLLSTGAYTACTDLLFYFNLRQRIVWRFEGFCQPVRTGAQTVRVVLRDLRNGIVIHREGFFIA